MFHDIPLRFSDDSDEASPVTFVVWTAAQRGVAVRRDVMQGCADVAHPAGQYCATEHAHVFCV